MKNILSKQSLRFLSTLDYLYQYETSSFSDLALLSNVSVQTIHEDIKKINDFIEPLIIKLDTINSCYLSNQNRLSLDFIYSSVLKNSTEYWLLEKTFFERHDRLEDYADSLFISLSTLKRTISKVNKEIKKHGFEITTNPVRLVGNEILIRHIFVHYFSEKYLKRTYPFNEVQHKVFERLLMSFIEHEERFINYPNIEEFKIILFVSLIRLQNGHHYDQSEIKKIGKQYDFPILTNHLFKQAFKSVFHIELTKEHLIELAYPLLSDNFAFNQTELLRISQNSAQHQLDLEHIEQLIVTLSLKLDLPLTQSKKEQLVLSLMNVRLFTVGKPYLIYNAKHYFLANLAEDFPLVYDFLEQHLLAHHYFQEFEPEILESLIYVLLTQWDSLLYRIQYSFSTFKVGVFMNSDVKHIHLLITILNHKFENRFTFIPIPYLTDDEAFSHFHEYDLILTNISNDQTSGYRIISIDLYPSKKDLTKLNHLYEELCFEKMTHP